MGLALAQVDRQAPYLLSLVNIGFDRVAFVGFKQHFGLTQAELEIAIALAEGQTPVEIAMGRHVSLETVRTQVKILKRKTGVVDISAIVRLLCGFSAGIMVSQQTSQVQSRSTRIATEHVRQGSLVLDCGRHLHYTEQGNFEGEPVLMFHNMPYGMFLPEKAVEVAKQKGFRILTPYRPGYGDSDPLDSSKTEKILNRTADDFNEFLTKLKLTNADIVGQSMGSSFALRFAKRYPYRVKKLFAISRAPIWRKQWYSSMPVKQRFVMRTAQYVPQLLPVLIRAVINHIDIGNIKPLMQTLSASSEIDVRLMNNYPEIYDLIAEDSQFGFKHGGNAFCGDCMVVVQDMVEEAREVAHKFHIIHGEKDGIVNPEQSVAFANEVPGTHLELVKGAGHMAFYSHWQVLFKALGRKQQKPTLNTQ